MADVLLGLQVAMIGSVQDAAAGFHGPRRDERGQTSAEYMGMLLVVVAIMLAVMGAAHGIGDTLVGVFQKVFTKVASQLGA
jgi:Flp pilus assembly pilin Flp